MSGTSMDGVDAALLKTDGSPHILEEIGHVAISYDRVFKQSLKAAEQVIRKCAGDLKAAKLYYPLDAIIHQSTQYHLTAIQKLLAFTKYVPQQIAVIGYPGQTMFHSPAHKISTVIGDPQYVADTLNITVIHDFRSHDIAMGGQGAPFAPLYHQALAIRDNKIPLAVVNCGGIANITLINREHESTLLGFDTGPGNGLIDRLMTQRTHGKETMDTDGRYGKKGVVHDAVLKKLYQTALLQEKQNYFLKPPPKSLDIGDMQLIPELDTLSLEDACATLEAFTADTIVHSIELCHIDIPATWVLTGGGWSNPIIYKELKDRLSKKLDKNKKLHILTANEIGWNSQAMEAQIFAYFAVRSLQNQPLTMPNTTGVAMPCSGGRAYIPLN